MTTKRSCYGPIEGVREGECAHCGIGYDRMLAVRCPDCGKDIHAYCEAPR